MDDLDRAQQYEELSLRVALSHVKPTLKPAGHCYYCDETVSRGVLFCSPECAHDYEEENRIRQIMGRTEGRA